MPGILLQILVQQDFESALEQQEEKDAATDNSWMQRSDGTHAL